jgi:hypothetical protein
MATLQQSLRGLPQADDQISRGPGGVLRQKKTLQQATQQSGLAAAPITPMAAEMTGADAQAAKMAGTPQQVGAALKQASEPVTLETALRRKQYTREATAAEASGIQKSADMQKLGGLGDRVTNMVKAEYQKPVGAEVDLSNDLDIIKKDPKSQEAMDAMLRIAQSGQSLDKVAELVPEAAAAIGDIAKKAIRNPDEVKANEFLPDLGYDPASLANLLGVTPEEVQGYSLTDLQNKINQVTSQEFTKSQQLEKQSVSPTTGIAERGLAREAGRELATTGVRASEADMQRLADEVSTANQVSFMGQSKPVTDWLADDEISAMVKEVVESPANSPLRKQMQMESPDFYNFITNNETALKDAASKLDTSTSQFKQIQDTNKKIVSDRLPGLSPELQARFVPEAQGLQSRVIDPKKSSMLSYMDSLPKGESAIASNELLMANEKDSTLIDSIAKLNPQQLASLGISKKNSNWEKLKQHNDTLDRITNIPPENSDDLIREAFSDVSSLDMARTYIDQGNVLSGLGLESGVSLSKLDPNTLKDDILAGKSKVSVEDAAAGNIPKIEKQKLGMPKQPDPSTTEAKLAYVLTPIMKDGSLSSAELNDPQGPVSKLNWDDLLKLQDLSVSPNARIDRPALDAKLNKIKADNTANVISQSRKFAGDPHKDIDEVSKLLQEDSRKVDQKQVKNTISKLAMDEITSGGLRLKFMDGVLDRVKNLGLLTPEFVQAFNNTAKERRKAYTLSSGEMNLPRTAYPWGIDAQGNPLPQPAPTQAAVASVPKNSSRDGFIVDTSRQQPKKTPSSFDGLPTDTSRQPKKGRK